MSRSTRTRALLSTLVAATCALGATVLVAPAAPAAADPPVRSFLISENRAGQVSQLTDASGALTPRFKDLPSVRDSAIAPDGTAWITDDHQVVHLTASGERIRSFAGFSRPWGVVVDEAGTVYVSDENLGTVSRLRRDADAFEVLARPGGNPVMMSFADNGDLLLPLFVQGKVVRISRAGVITDAVGGLTYPVDAVQASDGSIIVSEQGTGSIKRFPADGSGTTIGNVSFGAFGMAVSGSTILVNNYVSGTTSRVSLDGGPVTVVRSGLAYPLGLSSASAVRVETPQQISLTSTPPAAPLVGGSHPLSATGGASGNPVTFSVTTPTVCSLDATGTTVSFDHAGDCTIDADQAGGTKDGVTYAAAPRVTQTVTVGKASQTVIFSAQNPTTGTIGGSYSPTATGGASGQPVIFSSTTPDVCGYDADPDEGDDTVTFVGAGDCIVAADQAGNADYEAAGPVSHVVAVGKNAQEIEFTSDAPENPVVGGGYAPAAEGGGSTQSVVLGVSTPSVCSSDSDTGLVSFDHAGTCTVTADQNGDAAYSPANQKTQTFEIGKAAQTITFDSDTPATGRVGNSFVPSADSGSADRPVAFSSLTPDTCTVDPETGVVSFTSAGTCTVAANQAGDVDYEAAPQVTRGITVSAKDAQAITFSGAPRTGIVGREFVLSATGGGSGNGVSFALAEDSAGCTLTYPGINDMRVIRLGDPTVTFTSPGTCRIDAVQSGDEQYAEGTAQLVLTVRRATNPTPEPPAQSAAPTTTTVTTTPDGAVATVRASGTNPATTPTGTVTFTVDGTTIGTADLVATPGRTGTATATLDEPVATDSTHTVRAAYAGTADWVASAGTYERRNPTLTSRVVSREGANAAGWYRTPVTVRFACAAGSADLVGDCPGPVKRRNTVPGFHLDRTVTAADGGSTTVSTPVKVDVRGPVLDITRTGTAPWTRRDRPIGCSASDGRSGLEGDCTVRYGDLVVGKDGVTRRTWAATATDVAGNTTTRKGSYQVR